MSETRKQLVEPVVATPDTKQEQVTEVVVPETAEDQIEDDIMPESKEELVGADMSMPDTTKDEISETVEEAVEVVQKKASAEAAAKESSGSLLCDQTVRDYMAMNDARIQKLMELQDERDFMLTNQMILIKQQKQQIAELKEDNISLREELTTTSQEKADLRELTTSRREMAALTKLTTSLKDELTIKTQEMIDLLRENTTSLREELTTKSRDMVHLTELTASLKDELTSKSREMADLTEITSSLREELTTKSREMVIQQEQHMAKLRKETSKMGQNTAWEVGKVRNDVRQQQEELLVQRKETELHKSILLDLLAKWEEYSNSDTQDKNSLKESLASLRSDLARLEQKATGRPKSPQERGCEEMPPHLEALHKLFKSDKLQFTSSLTDLSRRMKEMADQADQQGRDLAEVRASVAYLSSCVATCQDQLAGGGHHSPSSGISGSGSSEGEDGSSNGQANHQQLHTGEEDTAPPSLSSSSPFTGGANDDSDEEAADLKLDSSSVGKEEDDLHLTRLAQRRSSAPVNLAAKCFVPKRLSGTQSLSRPVSPASPIATPQPPPINYQLQPVGAASRVIAGGTALSGSIVMPTTASTGGGGCTSGPPVYPQMFQPHEYFMHQLAGQALPTATNTTTTGGGAPVSSSSGYYFYGVQPGVAGGAPPLYYAQPGAAALLHLNPGPRPSSY